MTFANRSFWLMWAAQCLSQTVDRVVFILMVEIVSRLGSGPQVMSMSLALYASPNALFGAVAGVWADRLDKCRVMMLTNMVRAGLVLALWLFGEGHLAVALAIAFAVSTASQPFAPAETAAIPLLVPPEQFMQASSITVMSRIGAVLVGFSVGEPLLHAAGLNGAAWVVALGFVLSTVLLAFVRYRYPEEVAPAHEGYARQFKQGLAYIRTRRGIRSTMAMQVVIFSTFAALAVVAIVFAKEVLKTDFTGIMIADGVGLGVGAVVVGRWGGGWHRDLTIAAGFLGTACGLAALACVGTGQACLAYGLTWGIGFMAAIAGVPLQTRLLELVEDGMRGKVFGVQTTALNVVAIAPLLGSGYAVEHLGVRTVTFAMAAVLALTAWLAWSLRKASISVV